MREIELKILFHPDEAESQLYNQNYFPIIKSHEEY